MGAAMPRRADVEKQNCGVSGGREEGWVITSELLASSADLAEGAASSNRAVESLFHKMPASVPNVGVFPSCTV